MDTGVALYDDGVPILLTNHMPRGTGAITGVLADSGGTCHFCCMIVAKGNCSTKAVVSEKIGGRSQAFSKSCAASTGSTSRVRASRKKAKLKKFEMFVGAKDGTKYSPAYVGNTANLNGQSPFGRALAPSSAFRFFVTGEAAVVVRP
jgi:hypothetical protein